MQGYKQVAIGSSPNINPISVGYMKNKIRLFNEENISY